MPRTLETAVTSDGQTLRKVKDAAGRVQRYVNGRQVKQQVYAGKKAHTPDVEFFKMGHLTDQVDSVEDLGPPFNANLTRVTEAHERGTDDRYEAAEVNRWLGFKNSQHTPDDPIEAAREYADMRRELRKYDDPDKQQEVKESYNIGGS